MLLPSFSSLSDFLLGLLPVKILEHGDVICFGIVVPNDGLFFLFLTEDDVPVLGDVEQDQDQDCSVQKSLASESSWPGG